MESKNSSWANLLYCISIYNNSIIFNHFNILDMSLKILVKFSTRGRPDQFIKVLRSMVEMSDKPKDIFYLVSLDIDDDLTSNNEIYFKAHDITRNIEWCVNDSKTKIDAINRDMQRAPDWDIVLLASDDMVPQVQGWDEVIRKEFLMPLVMRDDSPIYNLDQALWFFDGHQHRICTLVIMGRERYEKFGYLYHPSYISLWCDNEWTEVNQPKKIDTILFKHEHPAWGGQVPMDALYQRNEAYFERDRMNYERRKQLNFPI